MRKQTFLFIIFVVTIIFSVVIYYYYNYSDNSSVVREPISSSDETLGPNGPFTHPAVSLSSQIIYSNPDESAFWRFSPVKLTYRSTNSEGDLGYILADLDPKYGYDVHLRIILSDNSSENPYHRSGTLFRPDYDINNLDQGEYEESYLLPNELSDAWGIKDGDVFEMYYVIEAPTVESLGTYCDESINIFNCEQSFIRHSDYPDLYDISTEGLGFAQVDGDLVDVYPYFIGQALINE